MGLTITLDYVQSLVGSTKCFLLQATVSLVRSRSFMLICARINVIQMVVHCSNSTNMIDIFRLYKGQLSRLALIVITDDLHSYFVNYLHLLLYFYGAE